MNDARKNFEANWKAYVAARAAVEAETRTSEALHALVQEYRAAIGEELAALGCSAQDAISWKAKRVAFAGGR